MSKDPESSHHRIREMKEAAQRDPYCVPFSAPSGGGQKKGPVTTSHFKESIESCHFPKHVFFHLQQAVRAEQGGEK